MATKPNTKIKLSLLDRIILPTILKKESNYKELIVNGDISQKVKITQSELEKYEVKVLGQGLSWNEKGMKATFEYDFTDMETDSIKKGLKELDETNKLTSDHVGLYEKFLLNK